MSALAHFTEEYLLNSLWQVPLIATVAWLAARMLRRLGPEAEHRVWVTALAAECMLPAFAAPGLLHALRSLLSGGAALPGTVTVALGAATPLASGAAVPFLRYGTTMYACVTVVLLFRLARQYTQLTRLTRSAEPMRWAAGGAAMLQELCAHFRVASVQTGESTLVTTPLTFGFLRPVLLLPSGFVQRVAPIELRAALSHELAHVTRRDAAKQFVYRVLSLPLQYHPAAWWTLAQVAETRERVCDRIAADETGDAGQYARSLLDLAFLLTAARPVPANAIGLFDANQFERRILMLNRSSFPVARSLRLGLIAGSAVLAGVVCTSALALHLNVATSSLKGAPLQVKVGSGVMAGQVVSKAAPKYPDEAKKAKIQGSVVLNAIIGKTGQVENLKVVSGPTELQASALDAVRQWVYKPYLLNGNPTEVETTITVNYSLAP